MKPLVSIIIPAYNAEGTISDSVQSAVAQSWQRKEIIVINDGSTDHTAEMAQRVASRNVKIISTENRGLSAAVNTAYSLCQGDYIQELDSDDILAPDKIERQLATLGKNDGGRILLSSPWAYFYYRTRAARFVPNVLWNDLSPVEWLLRKMGQNLHMQNATWLVSREIAEAAGPWNEALNYDQDGEYFCRVLLASEGTRFVPEARVFYRASGINSISYIGRSNKKKDSLFVSMKLHVRYLRSLEDSERVRQVCLTYLQNWYETFYPERPDLAAELRLLAAELGGSLEPPRLRSKYAWLAPVFGLEAAKLAQRALPQCKAALVRAWDKAMYKFESAPPRPGQSLKNR